MLAACEGNKSSDFVFPFQPGEFNLYVCVKIPAALVRYCAKTKGTSKPQR
jgi:hypothetical protein